MKTTKTTLLLAVIVLASAQFACQAINPPVPAPVETPTFEAEASPEGLVSLPGLVNVDGFACAAAMSINIAMSTFPDSQKTNLLCADLTPSFQASANAQSPLRVPEWFIGETNAFLRKKGLPLELQRHPSATVVDVAGDLKRQILPILMVNTGSRFHAIVIIAYDPSKGGFAYLDSLRPKSKPVPFEADFLADYGIKFQDAWMDTFELKIVK
ncbi:MAG TPA: hypothetical protein VMC09_13245 [Anaerolineales bacterium]|nr:hypothetical protein [Anaerolineales bacterium]